VSADDFVDRRVRAGLVPGWRAAAVEALERLGLEAVAAG
jgi:hypothetical protein